jgi:hypothetical protein
MCALFRLFRAFGMVANKECPRGRPPPLVMLPVHVEREIKHFFWSAARIAVALPGFEMYSMAKFAEIEQRSQPWLCGERTYTVLRPTFFNCKMKPMHPSEAIQDIEQGVAEADRGVFADAGEVDAFFAKYTETPVKLGSVLAEIGREVGGVDLEIERDRTPVEPLALNATIEVGDLQAGLDKND